MICIDVNCSNKKADNTCKVYSVDGQVFRTRRWQTVKEACPASTEAMRMTAKAKQPKKRVGQQKQKKA